MIMFSNEIDNICYTYTSNSRWISIYTVNTFQRDSHNSCIWLKLSLDNHIIRDWKKYNTLYFSNGEIGIYDPENIPDDEGDCLLLVEFEDPISALNISKGLTFSFLNQFDINIENSEVIHSVKEAQTSMIYEEAF